MPCAHAHVHIYIINQSINQIKSNQSIKQINQSINRIKSNEIKSNQINSNQIKSIKSINQSIYLPIYLI